MPGRPFTAVARLVLPIAVALGFAPSPCFAAPTAPTPRPHTPPPASVSATVARLPLTFVPNRGQFGADTRFAGYAPGALVRFERNAVTYDFRRPLGDAGGRPGDRAPRRHETLRVRATFPGANPAASIEGRSPSEQRSHFYFGNDPSAWRTDVPNFSAVRMHDLWPGIDLEYHGAGRELEYDFHVAPGADARRIRVRYDGVQRLTITAGGELEVTTRFGRAREAAPVAWQEVGGERKPVPVRYRLVDAHTFAFAVEAPLDPAAELVIDPVLKYSTYLGGITYDEVHEIDCDIAGNAYVVGGTLSPDFPASGTPVPSTHYSVFLTKIAPNGSSLVYSVFLGGSEDQLGYGLRVDLAGNAYLSGITGSNDFPTTAGCYDPTFNGSSAGDADMFVAKFSPTAALLYSTYMGGTPTDWAAHLTLDPAGRVWVVGVAGDPSYPTTAGAYDTTPNGSSDIVVSAFNCAGGGASDLVYSTFLGGSGDDEAYDIESDWAGRIYVAGSTRSSNFPASGGPPFNSTFDAVVIKLNPQGAGAADLEWGRKFGGSGQDYGGGVAPTGVGDVFFSGSTSSANYPALGFQTVYGGGPYDAFLLRLDFTATSTAFNTFVGGTGEDRGVEVVLDPNWHPVLMGYTSSPNFPVTGASYDASFNGGYDDYLMRFDPFGTPMVGTFVGGSGDDVAYALAIDTGGRQFLTGTTMSGDYPTTAGAYDLTYTGSGIDVAVTKFATTGPDTCEACASPPDTCCDAVPTLTGVEPPYTYSPHVLVGTRDPLPAYPYSVVIYDLDSPLPSPLEDTDWAGMTRYVGPMNSWNRDSLGTVFGLTVDEYGNIFVTHTSCYQPDAVGQVFGGAAGAVYRIDGVTGKITTFCVLPNVADPNHLPGDDLPGLGNITYDCRHKQFFVTNLEDGKIYRVKPVGVNGSTGTVVEVFDPLGPDNGSPGFAPLGERLWGVQKHGGRVYYSVWAEDHASGTAGVFNAIRSVGLSSTGAFLPATDQHELVMPPLNTFSDVFSNPVADISFSADGKMLLGERGMYDDTYTVPHMSRVLEYQCVAGCWLPTVPLAVGSIGPENSAGGVDYDRRAFTGAEAGRVWATGDALHLGAPPYTDVIYGIQGFRPSGGSIQNSMLIDSDGTTAVQEKTYIGDVEAPICLNPTVGSVCGKKFHDLDHDGVKDSGEPGLPGWTIVLNGPGGPYTAVTNAQGNYCFYNLPPGAYTLGEVGQSGWVQTMPAGGTWSFSLSGGQALAAMDFGNLVGSPGGGTGCVLPPPTMAAWWPFRETAGSLTSADVTHMSPSKNVLQLFGGAAIVTGGAVGNALCVPNELDYATVPNAQQAGLGFGAGPFAADFWLRPNVGGGGSPRMIVEKRVLVSASPYRTRGWAIYLNGNQLQLELGIGIATQTVAGPALTPGVWSHVAVSVARSPAAGRWYLNGVAVPAYDFVPTPGSTSSNADLYVGQVSPPFGIGPGLQGCVDELELFNAPLTATTVASLYNAGAAGKCPEYCRVPEIISICKDKTSVTVCMTICNNAPTTQNYHWSMAGLPAGAGCSVAGPATFTPSAGVLSVPANSCASVCVTMPRPAGLTAQGTTACYSFGFVNDLTGASYSCTGTIRADNTCWCVTTPTAVVAVPARLAPGLIGIPIDIGVGLPCGGLGGTDLSYQVTARYRGTGHEDPLAVSLNGLPPGEPVLGTLSLAPGGEGTVTVAVSTPNGYDPALIYDLVFEADADDDGLLETWGATPLTSVADTTETVGVAGETRAGDSVQLAITPNPSFTGSTIAFSMALGSDVDLGVYDVSGRLVRRLHHGTLAAGVHRISWDGRDASLRRAPAGVYFVRLVSPRLRLDAKLVKLE